MGKVFLPGDVLSNLKESEKTAKVVLGPGLRQESEEIVVSKPGILRFKEPNIYWIDCHQKRVPGHLLYHSIIETICLKAG